MEKTNECIKNENECKRAVLVLPITDIELTTFGSIYVGIGNGREQLSSVLGDLIGIGERKNVRIELSITELDADVRAISTFDVVNQGGDK